MLLTAPFAHGLQTGDASIMVGIIELVCPELSHIHVRTASWRTFLSCNALSVSSRGHRTKSLVFKHQVRGTFRTRWGAVSEVSRSPKTRTAASACAAAPGSQSKHLSKRLSKRRALGALIGSAHAACTRTPSLRAPPCGWQHCGASPPRLRQERPRQPRRRQANIMEKTPGSSSSARRGTLQTTATPGTH